MTAKRGRGRPTVAVELSAEERETLERWARRPKSSQALALRCRIVLAAAEGRHNNEIGRELGCHPATVSKWRTRFAARRLDGLCDDPRPGAAAHDQRREDRRGDREDPRGGPGGTRRTGRRGRWPPPAGISPWSVHSIWQAFGLKPHLVQDFKVSPDPQFVDKVRDIAGLYLNPPEAAVVLCVDEKTQVQALDRTAPILPLMPGAAQRRTHDYKRNGTTNLFAALDTASGKVISTMSARHRAEEFRSFLNLIDKEVPEHLDVHVVLDNVSTHKTPAIKRWAARHPRFKFHFTPTYSSWMNLVERWFSELTTKWLRRGTHTSVRDLQDSINAWIDNWNDNPRPFTWRKTADQIFETMASYLQRIPQTGH